MQRRPWHASLLQSLDELSDTDIQWRAWVSNEPDVLPTPTELICQLFDDTGLDEMLAHGNVFSPSVDGLLRQMSELASRVDVEQPRSQLLKDPKWLELATLAGRAYNEVNVALTHD